MDEFPASLIESRLRENFAQLAMKREAACKRSGRDPRHVQLVAVTKSVPLSVVTILRKIGLTHFGENRPQQLIERAQALADPIDWHLIGPLQRNKVRAVLPYARWIHSVASQQLLERMGRVAGELNLCPKVLLQVNISGEASKQGFTPDGIRREWPALLQVPNVDITGLMTMAPDTEDEEIIRTTFRGLRHLRDELRVDQWPLSELSMGMSHDFEIAIEEGATLIRVGSLLFEGIP